MVGRRLPVLRAVIESLESRQLLSATAVLATAAALTSSSNSSVTASPSSTVTPAATMAASSPGPSSVLAVYPASVRRRGKIRASRSASESPATVGWWSMRLRRSSGTPLRYRARPTFCPDLDGGGDRLEPCTIPSCPCPPAPPGWRWLVQLPPFPWHPAPPQWMSPPQRTPPTRRARP